MIFNAIPAHGGSSDFTLPSTIYIGYNTTRHYLDEWNQPKRSDGDSTLMTSMSGIIVDDSSTEPVYSSYTFTASNGQIRSSGTSKQLKVLDVSINGTGYDGWMNAGNDTTYHTIYHIYKISKRQIGIQYGNGGEFPKYQLTYYSDYQMESTQKYTISYDSIRSICLSPRSGEEYKSYPLYK